MRYLMLLALISLPLSAHAYCLDDDAECWARLEERTVNLGLSVVDNPVSIESGCARGACTSILLLEDGALFTQCSSSGCWQRWCDPGQDISSGECSPI